MLSKSAMGWNNENVWKFLKECPSSFFELFYPRNCVVCGNDLYKSEVGICRKCEASLPCTYFDMVKENPVHQIFWGRLIVMKATSVFFYRKGEALQGILKAVKYQSNIELTTEMGRIMGRILQKSYFMEGIDVIVPVPLHFQKMNRRGYNQSQLLAESLSSVTGVPVDGTTIHRVEDTSTQTKKGRYERFKNINGAFKVMNPKALEGKSILLLDDVITTGATIESLGNAILTEATDSTISVVSLAYTV